MNTTRALIFLAILSTTGGRAVAQIAWTDESLFKSQGKMGVLVAQSPLNARPLMKNPAPAKMEWSVTLELREGRAAGVMLWADDEAREGYAVYLSDRHDALILSRVGEWPEEERLDEFPWMISSGPKIFLKIQASDGAIRVFETSQAGEKDGSRTFAILEARNLTPFGNRAGLYMVDCQADYLVGEPVALDKPLAGKPAVPRIAEYKHIYDPGVGEEKSWYINDHCFVRGADNIWHLYGITHEHPANPIDERHFAHATASELTQSPWKKQPFALSYSPDDGENHLWAPHVIKKDNLYYMFYCAGSRESSWKYRIHLATSTDLKTWTRHEKNPIFMDYYDARDPMVVKIKDHYYLYYTANSDTRESTHIVAVRTSADLINWSPARVVFVSPAKGTFGGPTESPFVVHRDGYFYLFLGPADGVYHKTAVYRSTTPLHFSEQDRIAEFPSHAAEVVQDGENWYLSDCGWDLNGVHLAPMTWE